jgi:hypothetical protein
MALQPVEFASATATSTIEVFVKVGWQNVNNRFVLGDSDGQLTGQVGAGAPTTTSIAFLIDQKGMGDILQLQSQGENRVIFGQGGEMSILASTTVATSTLLSVTNATSTLFTINARGDAEVQGVIIIKDNSFAGSIATDINGEAEIMFSYHLGTGKPVVQLTPENENPVFAQVKEFIKDSQGNYTGFKIKTFGLTGSVISSVVHYNVTGKQDQYETSGQVIQISPPPQADNSNSPTDEGGAGSTSDPSVDAGSQSVSDPTDSAIEPSQPDSQPNESSPVTDIIDQTN